MLEVTATAQAGLFNVCHYMGYFKATVQTVETSSPDWGLLGGRIIKLSVYNAFTHEIEFVYDRGFGLDDLDKQGRRFLAAVVEHFDGARVPAEARHA